MKRSIPEQFRDRFGWAVPSICQQSQMEADTSTRLEVTLQDQQLTLIDEFQRSERLLSREAAVRLLLEIALEVVTGTGDRFWDKSGVAPLGKLPRR